MKTMIYKIVLKDKPRKIYSKGYYVTSELAIKDLKKVNELGYKKAYIILKELE
jgi:hypothetical protein